MIDVIWTISYESFEIDQIKCITWLIWYESYWINHTVALNLLELIWILARFDLKVILPELYKWATDREMKISTIKKGNAYFTLRLDSNADGDRKRSICFKDIIHYTVPMPMDSFLKSWNGVKSKLIFPYSKYRSIEEMRADKNFPPIEDFYNTLKQVSIQFYHMKHMIYIICH